MAAVPALAAAPASATPLSAVTSTFAVVSATTTSTYTANGNTFTTVTRTGALSGTFTGSTSDTLTLVLYADGRAGVRGAGTCLCIVDGHSGTFDYVIEGSGILPTSASGMYVIFQGTGGLAGLHAEGPWSGNFAAVNLGGQYHFD